MELEQPEPLRVLDDHDGGGRDVDTHFDDRRGHQHVDLTGAERGHRGLLVGGGHLPVEQTEPEAVQLLGREPFELLRGGARFELLGTFDEWAHHVRLPAQGHLAADARVDGGALERAGPDHLGHDGRPARRQLTELGLVEIAVDEHGGGARDGRRRHHEHVERLALLPQQVALLHAEAVLLVDDGEPEARELDTPVDQRVGPHHDVDDAVGQALGDAAALRGRSPVREQRDLDGALAEQRGLGRDDEIAEQRAAS